MKLDGLDYLDLSSHLTEIEIMVQQSTREFVNNEILPIIDKHFENGTFPDNLTSKIADMGFFGINLPRENGYGGMSNIIYGLVCQEIERGDSGIRSFISVQNSLVMFPIHAFGSDVQKQKWLPLLANGESIGSFGLTEPDHGSDPGSMDTKAVKGDGGYILNGAKMWITNGSIADVSIVWAKTEDGVVRGFLVEKEMEGLTAPEMKHKWSLRASITSELIFQDVYVPEENLLPGVEGLKGPLACLSQARYGIGWGAVGSAMAVYEASVKYAKDRKQFGKPISANQSIQNKLANMYIEIESARLLIHKAAWLKDQKEDFGCYASMAKVYASEVAMRASIDCVQIHGGYGYIKETGVERLMRDAKITQIYEGTSEIQRLVIARQLLK